MTSSNSTTTADSTILRKFEISTREGDIIIELFNDTPIHRDNFIKIANSDWYTNTQFHRVVPGLIIQAGDPKLRDPLDEEFLKMDKMTLPPEIKHTHFRGTLAAARRDDDVNPKRESSATQFFINLNDNRFYDGSYTVFGRVIEGMEIVDKISMLPRNGLDNPYNPVYLSIKEIEN
ncbi:MAG: peptidylprolyl isomerase [Chloroherpetonaceae bacterium]|nr:peptidylprolyl isomerase [Chloroherpetonaceae bacterium]